MGNETFKTTISVSQIGAFQDCQYKWQLMYKEGVRIRKGELTPSAVGSVFHEGIAAALKTLFAQQQRKRKLKHVTAHKYIMAAVEKAIRAWHDDNYVEKQMPIVDADNGLVMVTDTNYEIAWANMLSNSHKLVERTIVNLDLINRYEVVGLNGQPLVEFWLEVDLSEPLNFEPKTFAFAGVVDAVMYDKETGLTAVFDWKLHKRFTTLESEQLSSQIALYQHALRVQYGIKTELGIVYQIKSEPPRKPERNKDGSMSRRKITSDWQTYEDELILFGLNPDDYRDEMHPKLSEIEFYRPLMVFRTADITQIFWDNLIKFGLTITQTSHFPMALGYSCRTCPFAKLCTSRIYGYDETELFDTAYLKDTIIAVDEDAEEDIDDTD